MNSQQMLDTVIKPTLAMMSEHGKYDNLDSRILMLATAAIESDMGLYNRQIKGPAVSAFQLEPPTINDIARNWDAYPKMTEVLRKISCLYDIKSTNLALECETNQRVACLIARGKYAMDSKRIPGFDDKRGLYEYYKRVYNSAAGASTYMKWCDAWAKHGLDEVVL